MIYIIFFLFFILALCFKDLELLPHASKKNCTDKSSDLGALLSSLQLEISWKLCKS